MFVSDGIHAGAIPEVALPFQFADLRPSSAEAGGTPIPQDGRSLHERDSMGLFELLRRWLPERPPKRPPTEYHPPPRRQDDVDEEIAELIAIEII